MDDDGLRARMLDALIRSHVGPQAKLRRYDRDLLTPMNLVLDEAASTLPTDFVLYWVDGGLPEVFSEPKFSPPGVVFNSRFLEVSAFMRKMFDFRDSDDRIQTELSERVTLKLMAELALRYGDPSLAAYLITKSTLGATVSINTGDTLLDAEHLPKNETYMVL